MSYTSLFEDASTVQAKWNLNAEAAKTVYETWLLLVNRLNTEYTKSAVLKEAEDYFRQKLGVYDDKNSMKAYETVKVTITKAEFKNLVYTQGGLYLMRSLYTGGKKDQAKKAFSQVWLPLKRKVGDDEAKAEAMARKFNETYIPDESLNYVQYLAKDKKKEKNLFALKPYVVEDAKSITLQVWCKKKK